MRLSVLRQTNINPHQRCEQERNCCAYKEYQ